MAATLSDLVLGILAVLLLLAIVLLCLLAVRAENRMVHYNRRLLEKEEARRANKSNRN